MSVYKTIIPIVSIVNCIVYLLLLQDLEPCLFQPLQFRSSVSVSQDHIDISCFILYVFTIPSSATGFVSSLVSVG